MIKHVDIALPKGGKLTIGNDLPLTILAGPCALESRAHGLEMSARVKGNRQ